MPTIIENKKARWHYDILETWEAGLVLTGQEVKSLKSGQGDIKSAYISIRPLARAGKKGPRFQAALLNAFIPPYAKAGPLPGYEPRRARALLLKRREMISLLGRLQMAGLTFVPIRLYTLNRRIKLMVGLARGKTAVDKRDTIRRRETEREMRRHVLMAKRKP